MALLAALELFLLAALLLVTITQVAIPLLRGTPLFPLFREESRLEKELSEARQELEEAKLKKEIEDTNKLTEQESRPGTDDQQPRH